MTAFWWAFGSAFVVSLLSLAGIATIPFKEQSLKDIVFLLISLAAGALFGDAILHLFPEISERRSIPWPVLFGSWPASSHRLFWRSSCGGDRNMAWARTITSA